MLGLNLDTQGPIMRPASSPEQGPEWTRMRPLDAAARKRVSGPGLRSFKSIADLWQLSERERLVLLGDPPRSTYHSWLKKAREGEALTLPLDTLLRISAILGIHKALGILFLRPDEAMTWLKGAHQGPLFGGQSPLDLMLGGAQDGILTVRRHLDAWRGGLRGAPAPQSGIAPVRAEDLVFI